MNEEEKIFFEDKSSTIFSKCDSDTDNNSIDFSTNSDSDIEYVSKQSFNSTLPTFIVQENHDSDSNSSCDEFNKLPSEIISDNDNDDDDSENENNDKNNNDDDFNINDNHPISECGIALTRER